MKTTCRKKYRIKSKFRFITSVVIMAGLMIGIIGAVSGLNVSRALTETKYKEVQICYGDTLWDIANTYKSDDTDTNDIEASDLEPGMTISVPEDL